MLLTCCSFLAYIIGDNDLDVTNPLVIEALFLGLLAQPRGPVGAGVIGSEHL